MTPAQFTEWRRQNGFNKGHAALALGLAPNTITGYEWRNRPPWKLIPKVVALACAAISLGADPIGKENYD